MVLDAMYGVSTTKNRVVAGFIGKYSEKLNAICDTLRMASEQPDSLSAAGGGGVAGISRTHSESFSSWTAVSLVVLTVMVFIIVYRQRQYVAYRLRDFFSRDELYTFSRPQSVSNNYFAMGSLLLLSCCSLGLIVSGLPMYYPVVGQMGSGFHLGLKVAWWSLLFFLLKGLVYGLVNWVFFRHEQNVRWVSSYFFLTGVFSFLLYPFALIELYAGLSRKLLTVILLFLFITYEILLFYKLIVNFRAKRYGYLLIFLYFCAVELLPALFVWQKIRQ